MSKRALFESEVERRISCRRRPAGRAGRWDARLPVCKVTCSACHGTDRPVALQRSPTAASRGAAPTARSRPLFLARFLRVLLALNQGRGAAQSFVNPGRPLTFLSRSERLCGPCLNELGFRRQAWGQPLLPAPSFVALSAFHGLCVSPEGRPQPGAQTFLLTVREGLPERTRPSWLRPSWLRADAGTQGPRVPVSLGACDMLARPMIWADFPVDLAFCQVFINVFILIETVLEKAN